MDGSSHAWSRWPRPGLPQRTWQPSGLTWIGWLLMLFLTGTLTGSVINHFQHQLDAVVALALFIPLLIGTGGNAGSQTTSTIIRALAVEIGQE